MIDGAEMRRLRKKLGLTQVQLAEEIGVTGAFISQLESEKRSPSEEVLAALQSVLGTEGRMMRTCPCGVVILRHEKRCWAYVVEKRAREWRKGQIHA